MDAEGDGLRRVRGLPVLPELHHHVLQVDHACNKTKVRPVGTELDPTGVLQLLDPVK